MRVRIICPMNTKNSVSADTPWKLIIDTGGTLTDCLTIDPDVGDYRCKVLSSSSLRGLASQENESNEIRITIIEKVPDDFFTGNKFLLLEDPESTYSVTAYDSERSTLILGNK